MPVKLLSIRSLHLKKNPHILATSTQFQENMFELEFEIYRQQFFQKLRVHTNYQF